jgi:bifunctional DNase/RNase
VERFVDFQPSLWFNPLKCLEAKLNDGKAYGSRGELMEIEMKIRGLMMDPSANTPIIILKDVNGESMLPIWVGPFEANAIAVEIEKMATQRPMTHDLLKNVIWEFGANVRRVVITDLIDNTFLAVIELTKAGELLTLDSRPSDAIALALRVDCPIYVNEDVIKNSSTAITEDVDSEQDDWPENLVDDASDYKM